MIPLYIYGVGGFISFFALEIMEGGLDNDTQRRENGSARLGSARLGSARLGSSIAPFFFCGKGDYC